jgi:hypothetical protein
MTWTLAITLLVFTYLFTGGLCAIIARIYLKKSWKNTFKTVFTWLFEAMSDRDA